ncbi:hypothetical protein TNCV_857441 [Trichonephila clavipes]|nr:hypothetical protein TNCV_857441 [Trichonephila clavipes]
MIDSDTALNYTVVGIKVDFQKSAISPPRTIPYLWRACEQLRHFVCDGLWVASYMRDGLWVASFMCDGLWVASSCVTALVVPSCETAWLRHRVRRLGCVIV